jgi:hypothetical protein
MTGAFGTLMVVLLQAAVGGAVWLWVTGVRHAARGGFILLSGVSLAVIAWVTWVLARAAIADAEAAAGQASPDPSVTAAAGAAGQRLLWALLGFAVLLTLWQVLVVVLDDRHRLTQALGVAGALAGLASLGFAAAARGTAVLLGVLELVAGSAFVGAALYGLLLGHWYLFQRRLDPIHMLHGAKAYAAGVVAGLAGLGLSSLNPPPEITTAASPLLTIPGFSVWLGAGLLGICALIAPFVWKLATEGGRSIQAATGYFYLALIMSLSAELASKFRFFH